jgi:putative flippase GtrA
VLVGAMGMGLQLAALALFNRWTAGHYLYASAAAIELTLLHNFMWHLHYTWRDRRDGATRLRQFVRFHLSNGLVSMLGNLALMRLLVMTRACPCLSRTLSRFFVAQWRTFAWETIGRTRKRILVRAADHVRERAERIALGANFRSATNG